MTTVERLNQKAREGYENAQRMRGNMVRDTETELLVSLLHQDPAFDPRTIGIKLPDWLRIRLGRWGVTNGHDTKVLKRLVLQALYEVSKGHKVPDEDAETVRAAKAKSEAAATSPANRSEVGGRSAGATALGDDEVPADEGEREPAVAESEG